ncbi:conserved hypothetical protein [Xenorhabdus cabanillasii JM26]|uniref:Uncharacterized protein n=1 Tax=Xenorhabdus cabanillasii JM26 TaxID=1427517 RepID=W1JAV4_9GAMM|nr:hypothetical protein Xcab_03918 [Xenorhabdus cabanillasii JM26]CDL86640.1 conserved hypothetical protein [Xenorhabdus cabanillasii JM26]
MDDREELLQKINYVLNNNDAIAEDKLAVLMMFCFQLLSSTKTDGINMCVSDGRVLTLKFDESSIKH